MEQALVAGGVAILLWVLSRVPGFTAAGRLAAGVQRDQRIAEQLPDGEAKRRLTASVEARVLQMLELRGEGPPPVEVPPEALRAEVDDAIIWASRRARRLSRLSLWLSFATVVTGFTAVIGIVQRALGGTEPAFDLGAAVWPVLIGTAAAVVSSAYALTRAAQMRRTAKLHREAASAVRAREEE